jgi:hypothetical protein
MVARMHAPSCVAEPPHWSAGRRGGIKIRPAEFDAEMGRLLGSQQPSNLEIARLLGCGESTISRLRNQKIGLSQPVFDAIKTALGPKGIKRVCDFGNEAAA